MRELPSERLVNGAGVGDCRQVTVRGIGHSEIVSVHSRLKRSVGASRFQIKLAQSLENLSRTIRLCPSLFDTIRSQQNNRGDGWEPTLRAGVHTVATPQRILVRITP